MIRAWFLPILVLLLACSKGETPDETSAASTTPAPIPPGAMVIKDITPGKKGGRLIFGNPGDPKTFNLAISDDAYSSRLLSFLYDGLTGYDPYTQQDEPSLAKSWKYDPETREWTFQIREGLKWSDGHELTSDDFLFFSEVIMDERVPATEREYMKSGGEVFKFSAPDPLTFVAKIPVEDSFAILSLGLIRALPRHKYEAALKNGTFAEILGTNTAPGELVSSGPFKLKEFRSGERVVLEANPHYHQYDERGTRLPYLDEIVILNVEDFDALTLRFEAGDVDLIEDIQPHNLSILLDGQEKGNYTVMSPGLRPGSTYFWFNQKGGGSYDSGGGKRAHWEPEQGGAAPPPEIAGKGFRYYVDPVKLKWFSNPEFRKACSMAFNRDSIVRTILFGEGAPIYGPENEANRTWNNPDIVKWPFDLTKASEALNKIGFVDRNGDGIREDPDGNPVRFTIITNKENNVREKIGVLVKEDMATIGFGVTLQLLNFNDIITRTADSYDYEACILGITSGTPPHPAMGKNSWTSAGRMHVFNPMQKRPATEWEAEIDGLYAQLQRTFELEEQKKIYGRMQAIWCENQPINYLVTPKVYVAASNKIGNLKPTVLDPHLSHNVAEMYLKR